MTEHQVEVDVAAAQPSVSTLYDEAVSKKDSHRDAFVDLKIRQVHSELSGDIMSLPRDPHLWHGQTNLCFKNVGYHAKVNGSEKVILTPTSGAYKAGSMVALMARRNPQKGGGIT